MQYDQEVLNKIIQLKKEGFSSRAISKTLGISKSGVNDAYARYMKVPERQASNSRYLFIDLETRPDVAVTFKRFKANLSQDHVLENGGSLLSIAWRWMHDDKAQGLVLSPIEAVENNDVFLVETLFDLIEKADVVIGHNLDAFDIPILKSRLVVHNLPALKKVKTIDTLKIARQMRFNSNRLGDLGVILGEGEKQKHNGINTWIGCMAGKQSSLNEMLAYNIQDVELLYNVYQRLKSHDSKPVNSSLFTKREEHQCPVCGSEELDYTGNLVYTQFSAFDEIVCNACGSRSRDRKAVNSKEKRKLLLG